jgi:hypothetical protein
MVSRSESDAAATFRGRRCLPLMNLQIEWLFDHVFRGETESRCSLGIAKRTKCSSAADL